MPQKKTTKKPAKQKRFGTRAFCEAWATHGPKAKNWDDFVEKMRVSAGDPDYPVSRIAERIESFTGDLRKHGISPPKYPKKRVPAAVAAARRLGWGS
jgi:uncharacterized protein (DUF3084 family)